MKCELKNICQYRVGKVLVNTLDNKNYVSTENMLPDKRGIQPATSLPNTAVTQRYCVGDVLVSNIRPYFKKIYFAKNDGGCSNDVLVLQPLNDVEPQYLYYVLANDEFFAYCTASSKGTKMPRGDKGAIMQYKVNLPDLETQKKIAKVLSALDDKIELNNQINKNLEEQAQALYRCYFPYCIGDDLPEGWREGSIDEIIEIHDSRRIPLSNNVRQKMINKVYPYYGAASLMDYVDNYIFDGKYLLLGEDGTVIDDKGYAILQYVWGKFWVNNHAHILTGKNGYNVESLYMLFKHITVKSIVTGAVQPKISQANLRSIRIVIPPTNILTEYNSRIESLFALIRSNEDENKSLSSLRDTLLPKLMSGEIDVDNVEI